MPQDGKIIECGNPTEPEDLVISQLNEAQNLETAALQDDANRDLNSFEERNNSVEILTLKNLDTGEMYVIGENDPDFDFDTFQIKVGANITPIVETQAAAEDNTKEVRESDTPRNERLSWWAALLSYIYSNKQSRKNEEQHRIAMDIANSRRPKPPFTKLSNFKFKKELGRGAFGRVLLAESKNDGKLYALKIITKKNMRSSDKRQAKAERDILHSMTLKAPHPFTSGLKFAFQSENNLYLGMDFIPGGNLRELIKKYKYLPEVFYTFTLNLNQFDCSLIRFLGLG